MELNTNYILSGLWLGYPSCCVAAFATGYGMCEAEQIPDEFVGTGFRPCQNCVETMPAQVLLDHINRSRACPVTFQDGIGMTYAQLQGRTAKSSDGFSQWTHCLPSQHGDGIQRVAQNALGYQEFNLRMRRQPWYMREPYRVWD